MIRLAVRVHRRQAELVLAQLLELAPSGVEEVDVNPEVVEYAVYGAPGELPQVPALRAAAGGAYVDIRTEEIADDWSERWRSFHRPLQIGGRLTVRPPWEPPGETELDVVIDPGQAFGTGAHATTRLCLELMLDAADRRGDGGGSLVDVGCGSGVLAIVAAKLGFAPVTALDLDRAAIAATSENAARNGVTVETRLLDMRHEQVPGADLVVANVLAPPLIAWAGAQRTLAPALILSGLLAGEADRVAEAFGAHGMRELERRESGEWAALMLARASDSLPM
ncbi:MAG: 50S ribosomal protein L11 methyltransferase [Solirubrobacteraceae bacterium]